MKYLGLMVLLPFFFSFMPVIGKEAVKTIKISQDKIKLREETDCLNFISESFRGACYGMGFENLDSWKAYCSAMWGLQEIDWRSVICGEKGVFYEGFWKGPYGEGKVYEFVCEKEERWIN